MVRAGRRVMARVDHLVPFTHLVIPVRPDRWDRVGGADDEALPDLGALADLQDRVVPEDRVAGPPVGSSPLKLQIPPIAALSLQIVDDLPEPIPADHRLVIDVATTSVLLVESVKAVP